MIKKDFGSIIANKRKDRKLSQPQLAALLCERGLDVKAHSISKWEKNVNLPNVLQFFALCEILEISSADFGVRVCGDSMEPLYLDGQIIWIHKQETLEEGEIGVFFLDGDAYVKKYHQSDSGIQLISLNKKYAPIQVTSGSTLKTFGKVVG